MFFGTMAPCQIEHHLISQGTVTRRARRRDARRDSLTLLSFAASEGIYRFSARGQPMKVVMEGRQTCMK